jgi:hypothetical protein
MMMSLMPVACPSTRSFRIYGVKVVMKGMDRFLAADINVGN